MFKYTIMIQYNVMLFVRIIMNIYTILLNKDNIKSFNKTQPTQTDVDFEKKTSVIIQTVRQLGVKNAVRA